MANESAPPRRLRIAKTMKQRPTAAKLRSWCASIIRKRAQRLGVADAGDEEAAAAAAIRDFGLTGEQRRRLIIMQEPD
jgi:hypothetical protein